MYFTKHAFEIYNYLNYFYIIQGTSRKLYYLLLVNGRFLFAFHIKTLVKKFYSTLIRGEGIFLVGYTRKQMLHYNKFK